MSGPCRNYTPRVAGRDDVDCYYCDHPKVDHGEIRFGEFPRIHKKLAIRKALDMGSVEKSPVPTAEIVRSLITGMRMELAKIGGGKVLTRVWNETGPEGEDLLMVDMRED